MAISRHRLLPLACIISLAAAGCVAAQDQPCFASSPWPAADALFRGSAQWVGADGAFSIDLGAGRSLWLFGDTWIDPSGQNTRDGAHMIRNSVAIQAGRNPSRAAINFYWQASEDGLPHSFFRDAVDGWFWPGHGIRLDDGLIIFLNKLGATHEGLGFRSVGWAAVMIDNPDDEPPDWRVRFLQTPTNALGIVVGFASVLRIDEHLYAFGTVDADKTHPVHAARWPLATARQGDLMAPQWWAGRDAGWASDAAPVAILAHGQSELTIHFDADTQQFLEIQSLDFGSSDLALRFASEITGPWSRPGTFFRPPERGRPKIMIYSAKAHPQLTGADLVVTYSTNTFEFEEHWTDSEIYYPRFVRMQRCGDQK